MRWLALAAVVLVGCAPAVDDDGEGGAGGAPHECEIVDGVVVADPPCDEGETCTLLLDAEQWECLPIE